MGARRRIGRPELRGGKTFGEIFQDRQRFPDMDAIVVERGHLAGAGNFRNARLEVGGEAVKTPDDVAKRVDADAKAGKKSVLLLVNRDGDLQYLGLRLN